LQTLKKYKRIDVLVNNAGIQKDLPLTDITLADWHRVLDVNITGPFVCSREAVRHMRKQQAPNGGCIINISSVHQMIPKPHYLPYSTSKAGIEMMTKTLALELAKDGIRVNVVAPGAIETDLNIDLQTDKNELENVLKRVPTGRIGKAEEVANVVEFIASDKASYVTGSSFVVDGGMTLYPSFGINSEHDLAKHA
jgi:glucose 1-dehydrogenase